MVLNVAQYSLKDYLEPGEKGLVVLTNRPPIRDWKNSQPRPQARLFLWTVGRPRKVFQNNDTLYWLTVHNGELAAQYSPDNIWANYNFKNIKTGEIIVPRPEHSYGFQHYCSHNGDLFFIDEEHTSDRYIVTDSEGYSHIPGYTDSTFYKWKNGKKEEVTKKRVKVVTTLDSSDGILASMTPEPRGHGDNFIENIMNGGCVHVEPKRLDFFDSNEIKAICFVEGKLLFYRYPQGILDLQGIKIASFPLIERMFKEETRILESVYGKNKIWDINRISEIERERLSREIGELEKRAAGVLGYSYGRAMGAESDSWRNPWGDASRLRDGPECSHRRIALSRFSKHRFEIRHMTYFNGHLILAACQNLYAIPVSSDSEEVKIDPFKNKLWTFEDNIDGLAVVEGEELKRLKGNASVRSSKKAASISAPTLLRAVA